MQIYKVINNNMVSTHNEKGQEIMLKGLSIGYKKKAGDVVNEDKIEQRFILENEMMTRRFDQIIVSMDKSIIDICIDVIATLKDKSKIKMNDSIYVTLTDHVSNLVDRMKQGIKFDSSILWDIKRIYPEEYKMAKEVLKSLNDRLPYYFDNNEANFIALHIVNAEVVNDMQKTWKLTYVINDICDIVSNDLQKEFDENDYYFNRFIMHLKFLLENKELKIEESEIEENVVLDNLISSCPQAWKIVEKVTNYIYSCLKRKLVKEEQLYLMIHLVQIFRKSV